MLLEGKKILIMGIRNKWSIAFGIAQSVYENGGKLIFTYRGESNKEKVKELIVERIEILKKEPRLRSKMEFTLAKIE